MKIRLKLYSTLFTNFNSTSLSTKDKNQESLSSLKEDSKQLYHVFGITSKLTTHRCWCEGRKKFLPFDSSWLPYSLNLIHLCVPAMLSTNSLFPFALIRLDKNARKAGFPELKTFLNGKYLHRTTFHHSPLHTYILMYILPPTLLIVDCAIYHFFFFLHIMTWWKHMKHPPRCTRDWVSLTFQRQKVPNFIALEYFWSLWIIYVNFQCFIHKFVMAWNNSSLIYFTRIQIESFLAQLILLIKGNSHRTSAKQKLNVSIERARGMKTNKSPLHRR